MRHSPSQRPAIWGSAIAASLMLVACTGDVEPDSELAVDDSEAVSIDAPGLRVEPDSNGAKSAVTDQPTLGAGSVAGDLGSPVAEPAVPISGDTSVRANQGAANE